MKILEIWITSKNVSKIVQLEVGEPYVYAIITPIADYCYLRYSIDEQWIISDDIKDARDNISFWSDDSPLYFGGNHAE